MWKFLLIINSLFLTVVFHACFSQRLPCDVPGQCTDGKLLTIKTFPDALNCLRECQNAMPDCNWFTYKPDEHVENCKLFKSCATISDESLQCDKCITRNISCIDFQCNINGLCQVSKIILKHLYHKLNLFL